MATKPIPPKTAEKLREAQDYLDKMRAAAENSETFAHLVTGFLAATRSVKDVLINEITGVRLHGRAPVRPYWLRQAVWAFEPVVAPLWALVLRWAGGNKAAAAYITRKMRADREMRKLIKMRNLDIHEGAFMLDLDWVPEQGNYNDDFYRRHRARQVSIRHSSRLVYAARQRTTEYIARAYLPGIKDRDAYQVCTEHLAKVRLAVDDCVQKYG